MQVLSLNFVFSWLLFYQFIPVAAKQLQELQIYFHKEFEICLVDVRKIKNFMNIEKISGGIPPDEMTCETSAMLYMLENHIAVQLVILWRKYFLHDFRVLCVDKKNRMFVRVKNLFAISCINFSGGTHAYGE